MAKRMYPVIHFEMPAEDSDRAKKFYESVFGWQVTSLGPEMNDFSLVFTTPTDPENRMPKLRGAINGGFYKRTDAIHQTKLTVLVDDIHALLKGIQAAGGKVLPGEQGQDVVEFPGVGLFANFIDPEGNLVTIHQDQSPNPAPEQLALLQ